MDKFETQNSETPLSSPPRSNTHPRENSGAVQTWPTADAEVADRLVQLETENSRQQQLVAEHLIKNHYLPKPEKTSNTQIKNSPLHSTDRRPPTHTPHSTC